MSIIAAPGGGCGRPLCPPGGNPNLLGATGTGGVQAQGASGPGVLRVQTAYNDQGYPEQLRRVSDGYPYVTVQTMDAFGHATVVQEGNGVTVTRGYDQAAGLMTSLKAARGNTILTQFAYTWDGFGNLHTRSDVTVSAQPVTETEGYDALNRLVSSTLTGSTHTTYHYDPTGNRTRVCVDGACTTYHYGAGAPGPHAVTSATDGASYAYNGAGEMENDNGKTLTWAAFGKATTITQGTTQVNIAYGPGGARYQKTVTGVTTETVTYLQGAERLTVNGATSIRRTLGLAGVTVTDTGGAHSKLLYSITDHLGSTVVLGNEAGASAQAMSYAPFGRRMSAHWAGYMSITQAVSINTTLTDKGYTGQEGLDAVGLWNFNARLYDPALGRFLSVDPLIAHPGSTQSINPYSYVENNPLNKTDPTGEASEICTTTGKTTTCEMTSTTTKTIVPTGTHIPQTTTSTTHTTTVNGQVTNNTTTTSGAGALPGGRVATSVDGNSSYRISARVNPQDIKAASTRFNKKTHSSTTPGGSPTMAPPSLNTGTALASTGTPGGAGGNVPIGLAMAVERWAAAFPVGLEVGGDTASIGEWFQENAMLLSRLRPEALNAAGYVFFGLGALVSAGQGLYSFSRGNYGQAAKAGLDISMSAVGTFGGYLAGLTGIAEFTAVGGPVGFLIGAFYFGIDQTVGWGKAMEIEGAAWRAHHAITGPGAWWGRPKQ